MSGTFKVEQPLLHDGSYTVTQCKYGVYITGSVPVNEVTALMQAWSKVGYKWIAPGISQALGASFAITNDVERWSKAIEAEVAEKYPNNPAAQWFHGPYTGASSMALFSVLCDDLTLAPLAAAKGNNGLPSDADDFTRLYRVVNLKPEWLLRFKTEIPVKLPRWEPMVREWEVLSALYEDYLAAASESARTVKWNALNKAMAPVGKEMAASP